MIYTDCVYTLQLRRLVAPGVVYYAASWYVLCFLQPCCQNVSAATIKSKHCKQLNFVPLTGFSSSNGNPWFIEFLMPAS